MNKTKRISITFIPLLLILACASIWGMKTQVSASTENMKTFLDSDIPGITIQVNATAETRPKQNITVSLSLRQQTSIHVGSLNLSIFGFVNGTYETLMCNVTDTNFPLSDSSRLYNSTFGVPEQVWDTTYGEISLTYNATYPVGFGNLELPYNITLGFTMTHVENAYVESLEDQLADLQEQYNQLQQNYTALKGGLNELDNTRNAVAVLTIMSIFFVATTLYLVMRKPKDYY